MSSITLSTRHSSTIEGRCWASEAARHRNDAMRDAEPVSFDPIPPCASSLAWDVRCETAAVATWQRAYVAACASIGAANRTVARYIALGHDAARQRRSIIGAAFRKLAEVRRSLIAAERRLADARAALDAFQVAEEIASFPFLMAAE